MTKRQNKEAFYSSLYAASLTSEQYARACKHLARLNTSNAFDECWQEASAQNMSVMQTNRNYLQEIGDILVETCNPVNWSTIMFDLITSFHSWRNVRKTINSLNSLTDYQLEDIGVVRNDITSFAKRNI